MQKQTKKGMSLVEVMIVISIIGVLSSIVVVSMSSVRQNTRDKAAYMKIMSTQPMAYKCIRSSSTASLKKSTSTVPAVGDSICGDTAGYSAWPVFDAGSGWNYGTGAAGARWCNVNSTLSALPSGSNVSDTYNSGSMGGAPLIGKFCYIFRYAGKYIWCTQDGCAKSGF